MAKSAKLADIAAKAQAVAATKEVEAPKGWDEVDTTADTIPAEAPADAPAALVALASNKDKVTYSGFTLDLTKMSPVGIAYLLQYGYSQSLQDSAAGAKKLATDAHKARSTDAAAFEKLCAEMDKPTEDMAKLSADEFANVYAQHCRAERSHAIFTDTLGQRVGGGGPVDPITKLTNTIARETITAACHATKTKVPTGEAMTTLVTRYLGIEKNFNKARAEAERRHASLQDIDLDGIF